MTFRAHLAMAGLALALAACAPAPSAQRVFASDVLPILERSCAAASCHGVASGAEQSGDHIDWEQLFFRLDARGAIADPEQAYQSTKRTINTIEAAELSSLLRKPLAVPQGGVGHYGGALFASPADPSFVAMRAWIELEDHGGEDPVPLDEQEQLFADTVQPVLERATCMTSRCHGPTAGGIPFHLDTGFRGSFSAVGTRHNYLETLRAVSLDGFPRLSRVLRKSLPLGAGIVHKGTNFDFYQDDPGDGAEAIVRWACAERRARTGADCADEGAAPMSGFVFVQGPVAPAHPFDLDAFTPGSDLWLATVTDPSLQPSALENLTEALHPDAAADVRDPAVSRDGTRVVFAMRRAAGEGHHLWMLELATRAARQLTFGNGPLPGGGLATDRDPTFGPNDEVWFVSTRAGVVADQGGRLDAEIYSLDVTAGTTRRWTHTPHIERKPVFFDVGAEAGGEVGFSALRDALPGQARAHAFRFPPSQRTEYHQHFGVTPLQTLLFDLRELPDGRYLGVVGELSTRFEAGALAVVERNFGPEINERAATTTPALERYDAPMTVITSDGAWRDPAPLADGRALAVHQPDPIDVTDDAASFTPRIEVVELVEAQSGTGPQVRASTVLLEIPGVALTDPEPIWVRAPVRIDEPALDTGGDDTALLRHQGLPMIDALLSSLAPAGAKAPLAGIAGVRLVEHLPLAPRDREGTALGVHGPARILAELPVATDGSFQARVPAGVAFRLQTLDDDGMAIGAMHNRWYYTLPGQVLTQGISVAAGTARFGSRCAACHGAPSGDTRPPELEAPDAITSASLSLARFEAQNPRRPIEPPVVGDDTRVEVDFRRDVAPILEARCEGCHAAESTLDLSRTPTDRFSRAYESLLRPGARSGGGRDLVDDAEGRARASFLIERLLGRELDAPGALGGQGRGHPADVGGTEVNGDELRTLVRWIELGATFVGSAPSGAGTP